MTTKYVYDGLDIVQEIQNVTVSANYIRTMNIDEPLARFTPNSSRFYKQDALGSVIALTDEAGAVKTTYTYDPFGNTTVSGELSDNPLQYTGRENDQPVLSGVEGGLYYYRARYYSPELQRFISEDPIGLAGGDVNFYAYVGNNPVNYTDPEGLHWIKGPFGPIPHTHAGTNGPANVVNPQNPGAWPGDPQHIGSSSCEKDCKQFLNRCYLLAGIGSATTGIVCNTVCVAGTGGYGVVFCRVVCSGTGASVGGALQVSCYAAYQKCMDKCKCE